MAVIGGGIVLAAKALTPAADISGTWVFHMDGASNCGDPYDDWSVPVWQEGRTFYGNARPEPMVTNGVISGNMVTFSITLLDEDCIDGCGDFSDLSGTIEGNTITGTYSGHDCETFCTWEGNFTVTIWK